MYGKRLISAVVVAGAVLMGASVGSSAAVAAIPTYATADAQFVAAPSKDSCSKAMKLFKEAPRLLAKNKGKSDRAKMNNLKAKVDNGSATSYDLPGSIQREFPGEFKGKTISEIKRECGIR
ncbi:hypothetical protein ACL02S_08020 [Nocardia sp. 004]|uniref:hypothetical protein n=1 Tax=Nocardia sp. 004 TaxID=3385978 RepID=UPI0039A04241